MATRRESVHLSVQDELTPALARDAVAAKLLAKELDNLNGRTTRTSSNTRKASTDLDSFGRAAGSADDRVKRLTRSTEQGANALDSYSGRLSVLGQAIAVLGPGLIPIAAVGVPAMTGLATAAAAGAAAGGSLLLAMNGVADATKAIDEYNLAPTAANLAKLHEAMRAIGPDAREFVRAFQDFQPTLATIRDAAARGWFPGLTDSLEDFTAIAPKAATLMERLGQEGGQAVADAAESFNSERWMPFFDFVNHELPTAMTSLARIVGNLTHGAAEMWMAFDPGNDAFLNWLDGVARGFDEWASSAEGRDDVAAFLAYVEETGPKVQELFLAVVDALTQITQAAAPLSGPVLEGLTAVANVVAAIADSDLGTPIFAGIAALSIYNRTLAATAALQKSAFAQGVRGVRDKETSSLSAGYAAGSRFSPLSGLLTVTSAQDRARMSSRELAEQQARTRGALLRSAGAAAGLGLAMSGVADETGMANTVNYALMGSLAGPWGAAVGGAIGLLQDFASANDGVTEAAKAARDALDAGSFTEFSSRIEALNSQIESSASKSAGFQAAGFGGALDGVYGLLGGAQSDAVQQGIADRQKLKEQSLAAGEAVASLARSFGMTIGPVDGSDASLRELDGALAKMQPRLDQHRTTLDDLTLAYRLQKGDLTGLDKQLAMSVLGITDASRASDDLTDSLHGNTDVERTAVNSARIHQRVIRQVTDDLHAQEQAYRDLIQSMQDQADENLAQASNDLAYTQALKQVIELGKKNDAGIRGMTDAALENKGALLSLAGVWNQNSDKVINNVKAYRKARAEFVDGAVQMGVNEKAAEDLADKYLKMPKSVLTKISADATEAKRAIAETKALLASLHDKDIHINVFRRGGAGAVNDQLQGLYAEGGYTGRGGKYEPAGIVHRGEVVIPQDRVRRDWSLLKARYGDLPGFADGGVVGTTKPAPDTVTPAEHAAAARAARETAAALKSLNAQLDKATSTLQKEQQARQAVISQVAGNFLNDPFAASESGDIFASGATAGGTSNPLAALGADIKNSRQYIKLIRRLRAKGLDGKALAEVDTLDEAKTLAGLDRRDLRTYEKRFNLRNQLAQRAGAANAQGSAATVAELRDLKAEVQGLRRDVKAAEKANDRAHERSSKHVTEGINKGATKAGRK